MRQSNWDFAEQLARFGPQSKDSPPNLRESEEYCTQLAQNHYENFPVLTRFIQADRRQDFANVYAYCRWSDDIADEVGDKAQSLRLFDWWLSELDACYEYRSPQHPVLQALTKTINRFRIPKQPFVDLVAAFQRDQIQGRYETFEDLLSYCRCSADPVGRIVLFLCEQFSPARAKLSDDVCSGLQLVNFWQDVSIDIDKDRIYIPRESMAHFGVDEASILSRQFTSEFADLLEFELSRADQMLVRGRMLAKELPGRWKIVIGLFAEGGRTVVRKIRKNGYNVFDRRPKLSRGDFPGLVARTLGFLTRPRWTLPRQPQAKRGEVCNPSVSSKT